MRRIIVLTMIFLASTPLAGRAELDSAMDSGDRNGKLGEGTPPAQEAVTTESCEQIVKVLSAPLEEDGELRYFIHVGRAASLALLLDCPTEPPDLSIQVHHALLNGPFAVGSLMVLGAVHEYGVRTEADPLAARSWYRRLAFQLLDQPEERWDDIRARAAGLNPEIRHMSDADVETAWLAGELKSPILEKEIAAVQRLLNGPIADILAASDHLYRGSGGFPADKDAAKRILEIAARKGAPEARYALARGILDRRFPALRPTRKVRILRAQQLLIEAGEAGFVPAIELYAKLCVESRSDRGVAVAYALHEHMGGQGTDDALRRLKSSWNPVMDLDLRVARKELSRGKLPTCF